LAIDYYGIGIEPCACFGTESLRFGLLTNPNYDARKPSKI